MIDVLCPGGLHARKKWMYEGKLPIIGMIYGGKIAYGESGLPFNSCWAVLCVLKMFLCVFVVQTDAGVLCPALLFLSFFSSVSA